MGVPNRRFPTKGFYAGRCPYRRLYSEHAGFNPASPCTLAPWVGWLRRGRKEESEYLQIGCSRTEARSNPNPYPPPEQAAARDAIRLSEKIPCIQFFSS